MAFTRTAYAQLVFDEPAGELPVLRGHRDRRAWQLGRELEEGLRLLCARGRAADDDGKDKDKAIAKCAAKLAEFARRSGSDGDGIDEAWIRKCCATGLCGLPSASERDAAAWRSAVKALTSADDGVDARMEDDKEEEDSDAWLKDGAEREAAAARAVEEQQAAFFRALTGDDEAAARELLGRLDAYAQQCSAYGAPSSSSSDEDDDDDEEDDEIDQEEEEWDAEAVAEMERVVGDAAARSACVAPLLAARNSAEACAEMVLHAVRGTSSDNSSNADDWGMSK